MLTKRLCSVFKKSFTKCLSTVPTPKIENDAPEINSVSPKKIDVLQSPDYFQVHNLFTVKDLFNAKVHFGHKTSTLNPNMKPFVFGSRLGHVIFDLDITASFLRDALNFAAHIAYRDGIILFVSKNPRLTLLVERTALNCREFAVTRVWPLGLFTDAENKFKTEIRLPDLLILLNTLEENGFQHLAVLEAAKMCIPTIAIVDSNCNPNLITYPVPGNDDSYSSCVLYCHLFSEAILRGKKERAKHLGKSSEKSVDESSGSDQNASNKVNQSDQNVKTSTASNDLPCEETNSNVKDTMQS